MPRKYNNFDGHMPGGFYRGLMEWDFRENGVPIPSDDIELWSEIDIFIETTKFNVKKYLRARELQNALFDKSTEARESGDTKEQRIISKHVRKIEKLLDEMQTKIHEHMIELGYDKIKLDR